MKRAIFGLPLLLVSVGCFPWTGSSLRPGSNGCPDCAGKNGSASCMPMSPVSPEEVTPANARAMAKALEDEMDRPPVDPPDVKTETGGPRR